MLLINFSGVELMTAISGGDPAYAATESPPSLRSLFWTVESDELIDPGA